MRRVVITGATGMIGLALIEQCLQREIEVYALCRRDSNRVSRVPIHPLVHVVECNLNELSHLGREERIPPCDVLFHLAWDATTGEGRDDMELQLRNIQYTLDAVALAKKLGCECFVGAGSQAEYGRAEEKLNDRTFVFPENGYGMAKLCAGQMSRVECVRCGIRHVWSRILSVYGPNDNDHSMIISAIRMLLRGERPALTKGEQQWDYLYCSDAAKALLLLAEFGRDGGIYCIGSGQVRPLKEYMELLRDAVDPHAELGIGEVMYGSKQVMYLCADITKLTEDTGFHPSVPFERGIQETVTWVKRGNCHEKN